MELDGCIDGLWVGRGIEHLTVPIICGSLAGVYISLFMEEAGEKEV